MISRAAWGYCFDSSPMAARIYFLSTKISAFSGLNEAGLLSSNSAYFAISSVCFAWINAPPVTTTYFTRRRSFPLCFHLFAVRNVICVVFQIVHKLVYLVPGKSRDLGKLSVSCCFHDAPDAVPHPYVTLHGPLGVRLLQSLDNGHSVGRASFCHRIYVRGGPAQIHAHQFSDPGDLVPAV